MKQFPFNGLDGLVMYDCSDWACLPISSLYSTDFYIFVPPPDHYSLISDYNESRIVCKSQL